MLAFALRGIVLIAVLSWYSTSVWKMIDGYFKNKFDKYLKEEFEKNPGMKADMAGQKREKVEVAPREFLASCQLDTCLVDKVEVLREDNSSPAGVYARQTNQAAEKENMSNISPVDNLTIREGTKGETDKRTETPADTKREKTTRVRKKIVVHSQEPPKSKRKKVKTITLTEEDFEEVKMKMDIDEYDFTEFEYEEQPPEGILVSKLGFKPKADIGNLDRVTEDEFCPISLEYEGDCSETKTWP
ncbi:uncharacterized protein LOC107035880 [Diachasma alloeum]|uniref:uncharacterized protein LOC107035880 n=1 Tax=Diachasma alloeum TaxID=454923 RepID=UPI0007383D01|nr:uncharacterized protein LOC107035880 [Diachasma alloeum]